MSRCPGSRWTAEINDGPAPDRARDRVVPSGLRSYLVNCRAGDRGRKTPNRRIVIGRHGLITADQARRRAREMLGRVALGEDPLADRARTRSTPTLRKAFENWLAVGPRRRDSTVASYRRTVHRDLGDCLDRSLDEFDRSDVERVDLNALTFRVEETKTGVPMELPVTDRLATILARREGAFGNNPAAIRDWVFPSPTSATGHVQDPYHLYGHISKAGGAKSWFRGLCNCFITVAERELMPPPSLKKRLINHARHNDVTEGYAADWTITQLREPAQRIADRIEALMHGTETDSSVA